MNRITIIAFVLIFITSSINVESHPKGVSAGVIAYSCKGGKTYVLLAYDPDRKRLGHGAFGGRPKSPEEPVYTTAAREFYEETRCVYPYNEGNEFIASKPSVNNGFYSYTLKVPFIDTKHIENNKCSKSVERKDWVWVPLSNLLKALDSSKKRPKVKFDKVTIELWEGGAESLRQAIEDGIFPTIDPCTIK